jgi:hypothetical protein
MFEAEFEDPLAASRAQPIRAEPWCAQSDSQAAGSDAGSLSAAIEIARRATFLAGDQSIPFFHADANHQLEALALAERLEHEGLAFNAVVVGGAPEHAAVRMAVSWPRSNRPGRPRRSTRIEPKPQADASGRPATTVA